MTINPIKEMFREAAAEMGIPFIETSTVGIKKYSLSELASLPDEDRHAVRDESLRRHSIAVKQLVAAKAKVEELEAILKRVM